MSHRSSSAWSRPLRWFLLDGNRFLVAGSLLAGTFLLLVGLGQLGVIDLRNEAAVRGIATGFVPGLIAFLSIVLGINQLVLSQEFGSTGEIRDQIEQTRQYRQDVEAIAGTAPSPVLPVGFLGFVVQVIQLEATALEDSVTPEPDPDETPVRAYAESVVEASDDARRSLERVQPGRINALLPVLEYNDSAQLYEGRRLQREYDEALSDQTRHALSQLLEALKLFSVARAQFRTTYTQRVLSRLSRHLLYVGLPALFAIVVLALLVQSPQLFSPIPGRTVVVSALLSAGIAPLYLLSAYLLRIATISERTVAAGPFASRPGTVVDEPTVRDGDLREND